MEVLSECKTWVPNKSYAQDNRWWGLELAFHHESKFGSGQDRDCFQVSWFVSCWDSHSPLNVQGTVMTGSATASSRHRSQESGMHTHFWPRKTDPPVHLTVLHLPGSWHCSPALERKKVRRAPLLSLWCEKEVLSMKFFNEWSNLHRIDNWKSGRWT